MIEILEGLLSDVRDVASDFLRPELRVTSGDLEFLDMDRSEDILTKDLLGDQNRILEVIAVPRHERHEDVAA